MNPGWEKRQEARYHMLQAYEALAVAYYQLGATDPIGANVLTCLTRTREILSEMTQPYVNGKDTP